MERKYLSLSIVSFVFIALLVTAASHMYQISRNQHISMLDDQLLLLAEHKAIDSILKNINSVEYDSAENVLRSALKRLELVNVALLVINQQAGATASIRWINQQDGGMTASSFSSEELLAQIEKATKNSYPIKEVTLAAVDYRMVFLPNKKSSLSGLVILVQPQILTQVYLMAGVWLSLIIGMTVLIVYSVFKTVYLKRRARWLSMLKNSKIDSLTGLPNQQQLIKDLSRVKNTNLAFIKFHNFNSILNTYGPAVTDGVVKQISAVLAGFEHPLLKKSSCYHVNQSVFAILEDQDISLQGISTITKSLVKSIMTAQYKVGDGEYVSVNVTTGAVRQNTDAFMLANMALQEAESKKLQFYLIDKHNSILPETYKRDLALTQVLLKGIKAHQVVAYFQPIFSAKTRQVSKYECLARLVDDEGEIQLMPNVFIPLAHRANLYYMITKVMIIHAVEFATKNAVTVTLNLSITDIYNKRTCDYLFNKIKHSGMGHLLQFELLENEAIIESDEIIAFIHKLKSFGCKVGMDDLGKGHSNIERLLNLPIDFVKIDRSIMENVTQNLEMQNVARGIVKLAHKKGYEVVAEYCANQTLVNIAVDLGVDYLQGYHLGQPAKGLFVAENINEKKATN